MFLSLSLIIGLLACVFLGGAVWVYFSQQRKMKDRVAAAGTVVELASQVTDSGHIMCPVVEFTVPSGEKIRFTSDFGSLPAGYRVGQSVNVRYDPTDPQNAEIDSAMTLWLVPLILIFLGVISCFLAVAFLVAYMLGAA